MIDERWRDSPVQEALCAAVPGWECRWLVSPLRGGGSDSRWAGLNCCSDTCLSQFLSSRPSPDTHPASHGACAVFKINRKIKRVESQGTLENMYKSFRLKKDIFFHIFYCKFPFYYWLLQYFIFIVMHQNTKANSLYVKTYLTITLILSLKKKKKHK